MYLWWSRANKYGQVTAFIIIGLIILMVVGLVIVLRSEITQFDPAEIFPTSKSSIEQGINLCIKDLGEQALHKII